MSSNYDSTNHNLNHSRKPARAIQRDLRRFSLVKS